jgi:hypothetical protein
LDVPFALHVCLHVQFTALLTRMDMQAQDSKQHVLHGSAFIRLSYDLTCAWLPMLPCLQVWYAVPESANDACRVAMQDCLPHLFADNPAVLQQAAAAVSPNELRARGVPVCR